jgi:hypothetical protein
VTGEAANEASNPPMPEITLNGPTATYNIAIGKMPVSLIGKWTHEIGASHSVQGDTITLSFALKF